LSVVVLREYIDRRRPYVRRSTTTRQPNKYTSVRKQTTSGRRSSARWKRRAFSLKEIGLLEGSLCTAGGIVALLLRVGSGRRRRSISTHVVRRRRTIFETWYSSTSGRDRWQHQTAAPPATNQRRGEVGNNIIENRPHSASSLRDGGGDDDDDAASASHLNYVTRFVDVAVVN